MPRKIIKFCKRCSDRTPHRVQGTAEPYMACTICSQKNSQKHREKHWFRYLAQKANARKREGSVKLTEADVLAVWEKQKQRCAMSKRSLDPKDRWWKPSLDRIDNSKGYTPDNIRIVAWIINHCRGDLTDKEFFEMCTSAVVQEIPVFGFTVGYWD